MRPARRRRAPRARARPPCRPPAPGSASAMSSSSARTSGARVPASAATSAAGPGPGARPAGSACRLAAGSRGSSVEQRLDHVVARREVLRAELGEPRGGVPELGALRQRVAHERAPALGPALARERRGDAVERRLASSAAASSRSGRSSSGLPRAEQRRERLRQPRVARLRQVGERFLHQEAGPPGSGAARDRVDLGVGAALRRAAGRGAAGRSSCAGRSRCGARGRAPRAGRARARAPSRRGPPAGRAAAGACRAAPRSRAGRAGVSADSPARRSPSPVELRQRGRAAPCTGAGAPGRAPRGPSSGSAR